MGRRLGCRAGFRRRPYAGVGAAVAAGLLLAGCQPSFEERLSSAETYIAEGDYSAAIIELKNALRDAPDDARARALVAHASYKVADFATAADEYARALELGADTPENWIGLSKSLLRMGRSVEAFERVQPNLDESSSDAAVLVALGNLYASLGNVAAAERVFRRSIELDNGSVDGLTGLAVVAASSGDPEGARRWLSRATQANPDASRPWAVLGNLERVEGNTLAAIQAYQEAVARQTATMPLADRFDTRAALASAAIDGQRYAVAEEQIAALEALFAGSPTLHFLRGQSAFAQGDASRAAYELQQYLSEVPGDLRAHAVMGAISFSQSYYSQAEMYLQRAVQGDVGGETARRLLAESQIRLNRPQGAIDLLVGNASDPGEDPALLGMLGRAEYGAGNRDAAVAYFEQARRLAPEDANTNLLYATALIAEGKNDEAVEVLEALPDPGGESMRRDFLLIVAHTKAGDIATARTAASNLLETNRDNGTAHALVGSFKRGIGDTDAAAQHFRDALEREPENEAAFFGLASLALERGDIDAARGAVDALLDLRPASMPALTMLGRIAIPRKEYGLFRERLNSAIESAPQAAGPRLLAARLELFSGNTDAALDRIREAREQFPELAALRHLEGLALLRAGRSESALVSLSRAATSEPANPRFQLDLAIARLRAADFFGAREAIGAYRALQPDDPLGLSVQVNALIGDRRVDEAKQAIEAFSASASDDALVVVSVLSSDVALAEGDAQRAVEYLESASERRWDRGIALRLASAYEAAGAPNAVEPLERWLAQYPDDAVVRRTYGQMLQSDGDRAKAIAEYERVLSRNANDAVALNNLAWEYAQEGREEALELARRAYELRPDVGSIVDTYGWILHLNGRSQEAVDILRRAVRLSPENGEIRYHLARVLADVGQSSEAARIVAELMESNRSFPSRDKAVQLAESLE